MICPYCSCHFNNASGVCPMCFSRGRWRDPRPRHRRHPSEQDAIPQVHDGYLHAGFWMRSLAAIIDSVMAVAVALTTLTTLVLFSGTIGRHNILMHFREMQAYHIVPLPLVLLVVPSLISVLLYFALFESSEFQGTPGKFIFGIEVTALDFGRLTLRRALLRTLAKFLSLILLTFGFLLAGVTPQKQALHDMLCGTLVEQRQDISDGRIVFGAFVVFAIIIGMIALPVIHPIVHVPTYLRRYF